MKMVQRRYCSRSKRQSRRLGTPTPMLFFTVKWQEDSRYQRAESSTDIQDAMGRPYSCFHSRSSGPRSASTYDQNGASNSRASMESSISMKQN